jgi:hypothetical protein
MKEMILKWKSYIPIQQIIFNKSLTDLMLMNFLMFYSNRIINISISGSPKFYRNGTSTELVNGIIYLSALCYNISEIKICECKRNWLYYVSKSLVTLTAISVSNHGSTCDLHLISRLTNLKEINFSNLTTLDDEDVENYSTLTQMKSITLFRVGYHFTGIGLRNLLANKLFLVSLSIKWCKGIKEAVGGYNCLASLSNLTDLSIEYGLDVISSSLFNLKKLTIFGHDHDIMTEISSIDSLSSLTNLEKIQFDGVSNYQSDHAMFNYSTLIKINSISLMHCTALQSLGLSYFLAKKEFLIDLELVELKFCASDGYHCLTTLTKLTSLKIITINSQLDDIVLNKICSSCLLIEYLDIRYSFWITIEGLNNIHCLTYLKSLLISCAKDTWLTKLSPALKFIFLHNSNTSEKGRSRFANTIFDFSLTDH